jgi:cbb3-type cytochrome oxidase cytochrome c subunit
VNDRLRPVLLLLILVLIILAAAQLPGVTLPFAKQSKTGPIPGMNSSQCAEAGGKFDLIYGCVPK